MEGQSWLSSEVTTHGMASRYTGRFGLQPGAAAVQVLHGSLGSRPTQNLLCLQSHTHTFPTLAHITLPCTAVHVLPYVMCMGPTLTWASLQVADQEAHQEVDGDAGDVAVEVRPGEVSAVCLVDIACGDAALL